MRPSIVAADILAQKEMKTTYAISLEAVLPVLAKINIEASSESEAILLAEQIAESRRAGVKTAALTIEMYPADFLIVQDIAEIEAVEPGEAGGKVWNREEIEELLERNLDDPRYPSQRS
jgi:hypothetical protein